jgi:hypothetical protein
MKKLLTLAAVTLLAASLSNAQTTGDKNQSSTKTASKTTQVKTGAQKGKPGEKVALNPQPLPPKVARGQKSSPENRVALNPQPLPPGVARGNSKSKTKSKTQKSGATESGKDSAPQK